MNVVQDCSKSHAWREDELIGGQQSEISDDDLTIIYFPAQRQDASCTYPSSLKSNFIDSRDPLESAYSTSKREEPTLVQEDRLEEPFFLWKLET